MQLASGVFPGSNLALAAMPQLAGNSCQGFGLAGSTMRWASGWVISSNTLGLSGSLYDGDAGSRSPGKERDTESGNDYFGARYFGSNMGRFLSPDPFIPFNLKKDQFQAWIANPQHWNKYAYALNNPLKYTDPTGMTETIYYYLNKNLTDAQRKFFNDHKDAILGAIAGKLKEAGIKDVVFKDGSQLTSGQVDQIARSGLNSVALLNFANTSYTAHDWNPGSDTFGITWTDRRSVVLMGNLDVNEKDASTGIFRLGEVGSHELGHGMGFYSRGEMSSFLMFWNHDLMNEGQGTPTSPEHFDMTIPQNRQAVDEINKQPEYQPQQ